MEGTDITKLVQDQRLVGKELEAHKGKAVEFVENEFEADGAYMEIVRDGQTVEVRERVPRTAPREYKAGSIAALVAMAAYFADPTAGATDASRLPAAAEWNENAPVTPPPSFAKKQLFIFVNDAGIVALLDETDRREKLVFTLQVSESMQAVQALKNQSEFTQRHIIDLLRRRIAGEYSPANILSLVKQLKFQKSDSGESSLATGRESMSRTTNNELTGASNLPEFVEIDVPYFENVVDEDGRPYMVSIRCTLDADLDKQTLILRPVAGQLDAARELVIDKLVKQIDAGLEDHDNVRVFAGSPE